MTLSPAAFSSASFSAGRLASSASLSPAPCSGKVTHAAAVAFCLDVAARLCTEHELLTDVALGVGCDTRKQPVWTSTPCGDSSYVTAPGESHYHFSGEAPKACAAEGGAAHAVCCGD